MSEHILYQDQHFLSRQQVKDWEKEILLTWIDEETHFKVDGEPLTLEDLEHPDRVIIDRGTRYAHKITTLQDLLWEEMAICEEEDFGCLRYEMEHLDNKHDVTIVCFARLGLWNGIRSGHSKPFDSFEKILTIGSQDYNKIWYDSETGDIHKISIHHDGTNRYTFRGLNTEGGEDRYYDLEDELDKAKCDVERAEAIEMHTYPLGPIIAEIYGWPLPEKAQVGA